MIRALFPLVLPAALAACANFPSVDAARPSVIAARPTFLTPSELADVNAGAALTPTGGAEAKGAALRARADALRSK